jgi:protein MpaA
VRRGLAGALAAAGVSLALALGSPPGAEPAAAEVRVIGHSVEGRGIVARQIGDPDGERVALVVGVIHGDERSGLRVLDRLRGFGDELENTQLWAIDALNPDGLKAHMRKNARGVDLNRNFPFRWRGGVPHSSGYYPGSSPASEPETRAAMDFIEEIRPDVSIWYHQPWGAVLACRGRPALAARYARLAKMRTSCRGRGLPGTAINWENATIPGSTAFVVEFPPGKVQGGVARRHARAAAIIAGDG